MDIWLQNPEKIAKTAHSTVWLLAIHLLYFSQNLLNLYQSQLWVDLGSMVDLIGHVKEWLGAYLLQNQVEIFLLLRAYLV